MSEPRLNLRGQNLQEWVQEVSSDEWHWYVKVLSGNDTLLNESHQAGPYIPKSVIFSLFPSLRSANTLNPRLQFEAFIDSHLTRSVVTAIWYNNRVVDEGTRDEARITNWGGRASPLLDPGATGSICIFAFHQRPFENAEVCRIWLCGSVTEEDYLTNIVGPIEPGRWLFVPATSAAAQLVLPEPVESSCSLAPHEIPTEWLTNFPSASEIVARAAASRTSSGLSADERLLRRRDCEYEIFRSIEEAWVLPRVKEGFATVDLFMHFAHSVTNRRKSRSGASLQLHVRKILEEERVPHAYDAVSEEKKRPDFLFPSAEAYQSNAYPADRLRMLAVKTTCKDRWRQILNEADRIPRKHLLTLQEGVTTDQFNEMRSAGVTLVVPEPLIKSYPKAIRTELTPIAQFVNEAHALFSPA
jgi:hypothetical protein